MTWRQPWPTRAAEGPAALENSVLQALVTLCPFKSSVPPVCCFVYEFVPGREHCPFFRGGVWGALGGRCPRGHRGRVLATKAGEFVRRDSRCPEADQHRGSRGRCGRTGGRQPRARLPAPRCSPRAVSALRAGWDRRLLPLGVSAGRLLSGSDVVQKPLTPAQTQVFCFELNDNYLNGKGC